VTTRKLPVVNLEGEAYFFDFRLSQLRKVDEPHKFIELSPSERRGFLETVAYLELISRFANDIPYDPPTKRTRNEFGADSRSKR
jgi:hypothetical protein